MYFRLSYKVSGSLSHAVGAVYENALRQGIYAVAVISGAWMGLSWGLSGVAFGVFLAILINFVIMSHLALNLTALGFYEFLWAHAPAVKLSVIILLQNWPLVKVLRNYNFNPLIIIAVTVLGTFLTCIVLLGLNRNYFLGKDGVWFYQIFIKIFKGKLLNTV
jgi:PST family polysaccharide transporter